jgi:hypothetical protein
MLASSELRRQENNALKYSEEKAICLLYLLLQTLDDPVIESLKI